MFFIVANTIFWQAGGGTIPPTPSLVWNTATNNWEVETQTWN